MKAPIFSAYTASKSTTAAILDDMRPECPRCHGDGQIMVHWEADDDIPWPASGWLTCPECKGTRKDTTT